MRKFMGIEHDGQYWVGIFHSPTDYILQGNGNKSLRAKDLKAGDRGKIQRDYARLKIESLPDHPAGKDDPKPEVKTVVFKAVKNHKWKIAAAMAAAAGGAAWLLQ